MENLFRENAERGMRIASLDLMFTPAPSPCVADRQTCVGEKEFETFLSAYIEIQNIRLSYEPKLKNIHNSEEQQRIRQEANSKIDIAIEKRGLNPRSYRSIFTALNADGELRKKALLTIGKRGEGCVGNFIQKDGYLSVQNLSKSTKSP